MFSPMNSNSNYKINPDSYSPTKRNIFGWTIE
jgi:hypothetical protein